MFIGVKVTRIIELEEQWEDAAGNAQNEFAQDAETDAATVLSLSILSEIAQTPAANVTDVAVKIGIVDRELRIRNGDRILAVLLASAEQDCLRMSGSTCDTLQ